MRRTGIACGLFAAVVCWVALLALISPISSSTSHRVVPAVDGSRCIIKFIDKSNFSASSTPGKVTVRMDLLDGSGKPIVNLKESDFSVVEEGLPGRVTGFRGPQSQAINVILVIDVSGSMGQDNRITGARQSAKAVIDALKVDRDRIAIIPFWDAFQILHPLETLTLANRDTVSGLVDSLSPRGGTRIGPPTVEALTLYKRQVPDGAKMILVMTDGEDPSFANHIKEIQKLADDIGVQVHTIGFGTDVGPQARMALEEVSRVCSGQYQHAPTNAELIKIFNARVQETINECTLIYDSPYPNPDGLPRKVQLSVNAPGGLITGGFSYQVGPILGGRSSPATWVTSKDGMLETSGTLSNVMAIILFLSLLTMLVAGLTIPEFFLKKFDRGSFTSHIPTNPAGAPSGSTPLPPPPNRTVFTTASGGPAPVVSVNSPSTSHPSGQAVPLPPPPKPRP